MPEIKYKSWLEKERETRYRRRIFMIFDVKSIMENFFNKKKNLRKYYMYVSWRLKREER